YFLSLYSVRLYLLSFPTRRSSDLVLIFHVSHTALNITDSVRSCLDGKFAHTSEDGRNFVQSTFSRLHHGNTIVGVTVSLFHRAEDRKSTRLNSSHVKISYAVFCLK